MTVPGLVVRVGGLGCTRHPGENLMTSKQPVQSGSSSATAVITTPPTKKDSPAVERALSRSKLYLLVSWSLLYPEDEEFLDYLQCGEFVEDGRAAVDALQA